MVKSLLLCKFTVFTRELDVRRIQELKYDEAAKKAQKSQKVKLPHNKIKGL